MGRCLTINGNPSLNDLHRAVVSCSLNGKARFSYVREGTKAHVLLSSSDSSSVAFGDLSPFVENRGPIEFWIRLNPVRRYDGRRERPVREEEMEKWIEEKLEGHGFKPILVKTISVDKEIFGRKNTSFVTSVLADVSAVVVDKEKAEKAIAEGIGRLKAFGFGMPVIRRTS